MLVDDDMLFSVLFFREKKKRMMSSLHLLSIDQLYRINSLDILLMWLIFFL